MQEGQKAKIHGVPGDRARASGLMRVLWPLLIAIFLCGVLVGVAMPQVSIAVTGFGFLLAAILLAWSAFSGLKAIDAFFKGARGEESVALLLADLPADFHVFHDVHGGVSGGIDHVVVGPSGVFVIETKCWAGVVTMRNSTILIDGNAPDRAPLAQANASARAIAGLIEERLGEIWECVPVVCFASNTFKQGLMVLDGAIICNAMALQSQIVARQERRLTAETIERIVKILN